MNNTFSIIAHRGESYDAPENTLASVMLAWERKADAVEIDVHLTKDNSIVVIHDANTLRTSGVSNKISQSNYTELKNLDVGNYKNPKYKGEHIPLLKDILATVPSRKKLLVEIKSDSTIIPFLKTEIENSNLKTNQLILMSFSFKIIKKVKNELPDNFCYWLYSPLLSSRRILSFRLISIIKKIKSANLDGINVEKGKWINEVVVDKIKYTGLDFFVWTVNDFIEADRYRKLGIDGIASDRASWIKNEIFIRKNK